MRIVRITMLALLVIGLARTSLADDPGFKLIVHPDHPGDAIDRELIRDVFLKKRKDWPDGRAAHPIDLASKFPARDKFIERVLRKTPSQLKRYWNQQIFSGKGVPPPETEHVAGAVAYVLANKGAIGYLPPDADAGRAKVIRIR